MAALFRFRHFQSRLIVFFLVPLLAVLVAVYAAVTRANTRNALAVIADDLTRGAENFDATIDLRNYTLAVAGDTLSRDFATREALATNDAATLLSALENLFERIGLADFITMVDEGEARILADTLHPELVGTPPTWLPLIERARALDRQGEYPEAADFMLLDGRPYHLTLIPFLSPDLVAWIALGFELDADFVATFEDSVAAAVTVLYRDDTGRWQAHGSTLPDALVPDLVAQFDAPLQANQSYVMSLAGSDYVTLALPLGSGIPLYVVLQRSLTAQLAPFEALQGLLFTIFALGLVVLALAALVTSRKVTQPVRQLAAGARRIEAGDYRQRVDIALHDEIGELAQAFNGMAQGLAEKEKVRNLLGKVVSPEVASELLSRDIELGGEEREVTVLFSDLRGFTTLCEGRSPQEILALLNEYFSAVTAVIEANGGIVDKFIGDAVMALFGAPVAQPDAATRAVRAAFGMVQALEEVNAAFARRGLPPLALGIGINTGNVVAGNMGSPSRLNYTVIGDGVNLASRLEGLTKQYGVPIIVSAACAEVAQGFAWRDLGLAQVKGRQESVRIFAPQPPAAGAVEAPAAHHV